MYEYYNAPLFAAITSWVTAQIIKTFFYIIKHRSFNKERIFGAGGMPSSHSATVCSLATVISRIEGVTSVAFALSIVFAMVVMYDATGVRRAAGLHAREINRLRLIISRLQETAIDKVSKEEYENEQEMQNEAEEEIKELKESLGHTPTEAICGALLGIIIGTFVAV